MTKQKRMSKKKNTTIVGGFPLISLHMRRMREIIIYADPLFLFLVHPLIQIMNIHFHNSSLSLEFLNLT